MANTPAVNPARNFPANELDFSIRNAGSIFLLDPRSASAEAWVDEYIGADNGFQPYGPSVVIEPRYVADIVQGIQNDGLAVPQGQATNFRPYCH